MINFNLKKENEALYISIYKQIKGEILKNNLKPNEMLESKRKLSERLGVSINTIMQAYELLLEEGLIISIPQKGYYVIDYKLPKHNNNLFDKDIEKINYKYDFTTKNIDDEAFPYYTWSKISKNILYNDKRIISKSNNKGLYELRESISKHLYDAKGILAHPNNIIIGSGIEYLFSIITDIIPGKTYAIENPGYSKIQKILLNNNKNINYVNMDEEGVIIGELKNSDCVYLTPENQFPTGIKTSINRRIELAKWAENNKYIIEDDYDSAFKYMSASYISIFSLNKEKTIYLSTFSRSITPGLRISYMILPDDLLKVYESKFSTYSSTVSTIDQLILNEFISGGYYNRHLNKTKILYKQKRDIIIKELEFNNIEIDYKDSLFSIIINVKDLNVELFKKNCNNFSIDISVLQDYFFNFEKSNKIIIGFSGIKLSELNIGIKVLIDVINKSKTKE